MYRGGPTGLGEARPVSGTSKDPAILTAGRSGGAGGAPAIVASGESGLFLIPIEISAGGDAPFRRGDPTADGAVDLSDPIAILAHLFLGAPAPVCPDSADANDDGELDLSDPVAILSYLFLAGPDPPEPSAACGADPTPDSLPCPAFDPCR